MQPKSNPRLGRGGTGIVTRTLDVVTVTLVPVKNEDLQLLPKIGPRDAVEEKVDAVVHVKDDASDHKHTFQVVEVLREIVGCHL